MQQRRLFFRLITPVLYFSVILFLKPSFKDFLEFDSLRSACFVCRMHGPPLLNRWPRECFLELQLEHMPGTVLG